MLIKLKNKETLVIDDFKFNCSVGKKGTKNNKIEGEFVKESSLLL